MARMEVSGLRYTLIVDTPAPETFVVSVFTLHEQLSTPFILEHQVASTNYSIADYIATLTIWHDTGVQRIVNGIVIGVEQGDTGRHQTHYRLSVRPALWRAGFPVVTITVSIAFSAFLVLARYRFATTLAYIQVPARLLLIVPSLSFLPWLVKTLNINHSALGIGVALVIISEALKIWTLNRKRKS